MRCTDNHKNCGERDFLRSTIVGRIPTPVEDFGILVCSLRKIKKNTFSALRPLRLRPGDEDEEFSTATFGGCFAKTQHIKDRLISGGRTGKLLLGRGGGEDRSFYKQCTCSSVH